MSHWNYRLCKTTYNKGEPHEEISLQIHEAYCNPDGSIWAVTENPVTVHGETIEEVKRSLEWMALALNKDVIDLDTYVFAKSDFEANDKSGVDWSKINEPGFEEEFAEELAKLEEEDQEKFNKPM